MSYSSGFGSGYGGSSSAPPGTQDRGKIMDQVRSQIAVASAQELIQVCDLVLIHVIPGFSPLYIHRKCQTNVSESASTILDLNWTVKSR